MDVEEPAAVGVALRRCSSGRRSINLHRVVNPAGVADRLPKAPYDASLLDETRDATVHTYDDDDLLQTTYLPWDSKGGTDANGVNQGNQNERRFRQNRRYDGRGRLETISNPFKFGGGTDPDEIEADRVCYGHYDSDWIKTSTEPTAGTCASARQVVTYEYDRRGLQTAWNDRNEGTDRVRSIRRTFYPNGTLRQREAEPAAGSSEPFRAYAYLYNPNRSLVSFRQTQGGPERTTRIIRDAAERERVVNEAWGEGDRDTLNRFDAAGNVTERRTDGTWDGQDGYSGGTQTAFAYDAREQETSARVTDPGSSGARLTETGYYPSGDLKRRTKGFSGVTETYSYAADGRLANMSRDLAGSADDKNQNYDYDRNGNRTLDERGAHRFNARDQLVRWDPSKGPASARDMVSYILDGSGQTKRKLDEAGQNTSYDYLADRLTQATTGGQTTVYDYNDFGSITCAHLQGQPCSASSSTTYEYDAFERRVGSSKEPNTTYAYDGLDRRDTKTTSGQTREFAYLGTSELLTRERDSGQTKRYDYDSQGRRQGQSVGGSYRSYGKDANGSVEALESSSGAQLGRYDYDPYGELTAEGQLSPAAQDNPFRFQGFYYDSGVQTYDMQARTYAPEIGRFLNQDRYEAAGADLALQSDPLTQNRYAFAGGNPVSNVEWDGHFTDPGGGSGAGNPDPELAAELTQQTIDEGLPPMSGGVDPYAPPQVAPTPEQAPPPEPEPEAAPEPAGDLIPGLIGCGEVLFFCNNVDAFTGVAAEAASDTVEQVKSNLGLGDENEADPLGASIRETDPVGVATAAVEEIVEACTGPPDEVVGSCTATVIAMVVGRRPGVPDGHSSSNAPDSAPAAGVGDDVPRKFVTTPRGTTFDVPGGWQARTADNGRGIVYQRPGAPGNADMIRIMDPTTQYPSGYFRYYNGRGQPLDVYGKPGPPSTTHIPEDHLGSISEWPR